MSGSCISSRSEDSLGADGMDVVNADVVEQEENVANALRLRETRLARLLSEMILTDERFLRAAPAHRVMRCAGAFGGFSVSFGHSRAATRLTKSDQRSFKLSHWGAYFMVVGKHFILFCLLWFSD